MKKLSSNKSTYRAEIDGLRAFAVLSVVAFHTFPNWLKGGFIGVDIFFVISGFLITINIFENLNKGQFSFIDFFSRRIRRIFPALILVMVCSLIFGWFVLLSDDLNQLGKHIAGGTAFVSNFIFAEEVGYFDTQAEYKPMLHLWSLAVEEQFYIFWPLTLWIAWKLKQNLLFLCFFFMMSSFFINIFWVQRFPTEIYFWPFGRFWELLVGSILAWAMLYKANIFLAIEEEKYNLSYFINKFNNSGVTTFIGIIALIASAILINKDDPFPSYQAIFPIFGTVMVIIGGGVNSISKLVLSNKIVIWFGLISYPLYLWHWPIISYFHIIEGGTPHRNSTILAIVFSILFAWITYRFVEKPIRFVGSKKTLRTIALCGIIFLIGLLGVIVSFFDFKDSNGVEDVYLREGLEHNIGSSSRWYNGIDSWLFLGNSSSNTVAKLKLSTKPSRIEIASTKDTFYKLSSLGKETNTKIVLLVSPNKSSVYSEMLPPEISASPTRYINFFLNELNGIENLVVYDPTNNFLEIKELEGLLYYRTGTHWNSKGAYIAFRNMLSKLGYKTPNVKFSLKETIAGELIGISELDNFPLKNDDTWLAKIDHSYELKRIKNSNTASNEAFGDQEIVYNSNPIINKKIWLIGDSFTNAMKPYFEATFREVNYLGHWNKRLDGLSYYLEKSPEKPDIIVIMKTERFF